MKMKISQAWVFKAALLRHCLGFFPFSSRVPQGTIFHIYLSSFHCPILGIAPAFGFIFCVAQVVKNPPANAEDIRDTGSIPGWGRSPEGGNGNGNPLQYSCLRNPMDRGTLGATVHGVTKESDTTERLTHTVLKWAQGSKYHHMPMFLCFCLHPRPLLNSRLRWPTA